MLHSSGRAIFGPFTSRGLPLRAAIFSFALRRLHQPPKLRRVTACHNSREIKWEVALDPGNAVVDSSLDCRWDILRLGLWSMNLDYSSSKEETLQLARDARRVMLFTNIRTICMSALYGLEEVHLFHHDLYSCRWNRSGKGHSRFALRRVGATREGLADRGRGRVQAWAFQKLFLSSALLAIRATARISLWAGWALEHVLHKIQLSFCFPNDGAFRNLSAESTSALGVLT